MREVVDLTCWERADNYRFFQNFLNPSFSVTTEVECTQGRATAKEKGQSFFLYYLYATLRAANEVKEFRYRIEEEEVIYYTQVDIMTPIRVNESGKFVTARIVYYEDFNTFYAEAKKVIENISEDSDPYEEDYKLWESKQFNVIVLSATPNLFFTSLGYTQFDSKGSKYPLMNAGKIIVREGFEKIPFALTIHHGFVDGYHIGLFFEKVEKYLNYIH